MIALEPKVLRCETTHNVCGTDAWSRSKPCACAPCREWMLEAPDGVDETQRVLVSGRPIEAHRVIELKENGQQTDYVVLSAVERAKGFTRPYRDSYKHLVASCGAVTVMGHSLAATYARDPFFYSSTFCVRCRGHFPVGSKGEFVWVEGDGSKRFKVGT